MALPEIAAMHLCRGCSTLAHSWFAVALFAFLPVLVTAETTDNPGGVRLFVRAIEATNPIHSDSTASPTQEQSLEGDISDLRSKLQHLPFSFFRLVCKRHEEISLLRKDVMPLPRGQSLAFRPVYMEKKRVGMWLNWKDASGGDILNTRIHFDTDESVLTGTDSSQDSGLILAIRAIPIAAAE